MSPELGKQVIEVARKLVGSHYINGGYGATPGNQDGHPARKGSVELIESHDRLDPTLKSGDQQKDKNLAVFAASTNIPFVRDGATVKRYCVCAGNYHNPAVVGAREGFSTDQVLIAYLDKLKPIKNTFDWPNYTGNLTPRRAFGPGPGGDISGTLIWGEACTDIPHFDCVGFVNYCLWKAGGPEVQLSIAAWCSNPNPMGAQVFELSKSKPATLLDGDILAQNPHHIGFVSKEGKIIEARDTDLGVMESDGAFSLQAPGDWTHLVRISASTAMGQDPQPAKRYPGGPSVFDVKPDAFPKK